MKSDGAKIMIFSLFGKLKIFLWIIKFRYDDDDDSDNQKIKGTERDFDQENIDESINIFDIRQQVIISFSSF
jgi:hypothetical protein